MQYNITANNLQLIVKKFFIDLSLDSNEPISNQEIKEAIEAMDIFEKKNDSDKLNNIRKIAYLAVNPEYQDIQLEFIYSILVSNDNHSIIAALYNKSENEAINNNLTISVKGDISTELKDLLIPVANSPEEQNISNINPQYKVNTFSWEQLNKISQNIWSDKEYILSNFYEYHLEDIVKLADKKLWEDPDFIGRIQHIESILDYLPISVRYNEVFLDTLKKDYRLLSKMFDSNYAPLFSDSTYSNPIKELEEEQAKNYKEENNEIIIKAHKIKERFLQLIEDKDMVIGLLDQNETYKIYDLANDTIKHNKEVVKTLFTMTSLYSGVEQYLPKDIFKDEEILMKYLSTVFSKCKNVKQYPFIYQDWIKDKEKVLKYLEVVPFNYNGPINELFDFLPKALKNDKDVLSFFVSHDYHLYEKLAEPFRMSKKLLFAYVKKGGQGANMNHIPTYALEYLTKEEKMYVLENMPNIMMKKDLPEEFKNDLNLISCCGKILKFLDLSEQQLEALSNDTEKSVKLVQAAPANFKLLTANARKNPEIVFAFINTNNDYEVLLKDNENLIPKSVWGSRSFCLNVIKNVYYNMPILQKIPQDFWNDTDFVREIAQEIDKGQLTIKAFNNGPPLINELIKTHNMKPGNVTNQLLKLISQSELEQRLEDKMPPKENKTKKQKI